jgi:hypothetical protein
MFWKTKEFGPAVCKATFPSSSPTCPATQSSNTSEAAAACERVTIKGEPVTGVERADPEYVRKAIRRTNGRDTRTANKATPRPAPTAGRDAVPMSS